MSVKTYTNIRHNNLTKIAKYMFFMEQCLYMPNYVINAFQKLERQLSEKIKSLNVFVDDNSRSDYSLQEQLDSDSPEYLYYVIADTTNPRFSKQLAELKKSEHFVDCYQHKNIDSNKAVIRFKVCVKSRFEKLLKSEYSKMFTEEEQSSILKNKPLLRMYTHYNFENERDELDSTLHVLMHTEEGLQRLVDKFTIDDPDTIAIMADHEYDDKFDIDKEILNFNTYN